MYLNELPIEIQNELNEKKSHLQETMGCNDSYTVTLINNEGTRYFHAQRRCISWSDDKGNYMPFGGGTYWAVSYGVIKWARYKTLNPLGIMEYSYDWIMSSQRFRKSHNGVEIPAEVKTKKDVLAIAKQIGIFNI